MYLEIKNIHKFFGTGENRTEVLKGINCNIEKGSICVLLGPSGSGKSTLLNIIGGIETAEEGSISINGDTIENMNEKQLHSTEESTLVMFFSPTTSFQTLL